ncbi:MAG: hypothetical protein OHK0024_30560 [Thalassobaculales bacterium]
MIQSIGQIPSGYQAYAPPPTQTPREDRESTRQITRDPVRSANETRQARSEDDQSRRTEEEGEGRVQQSREARQQSRGSQVDIFV